MRIVHIISRFNRGGTASWLKVLISEQDRLNHEVFLLAGNVSANEIEDSFFSENCGIRVTHLGRKIGFLRNVFAFFEIRILLKKLHPDLVNTHTSNAGLLGRLAAYSLGSNRPAIVHTYHGHILYGYFNRFLVFFFVKIEIFLAKISDLLLSSGTKVMEELIDVGISNQSKFYVVRPGVIHDAVLNTRIEKQNLTIGWLGRLTAIKRPDRVIELAKYFENIEFLIGGEGELKTKLAENLPKNVHLLGWVDPFEFWSKCDIALLTSDNEAQPISLIEAANHGLPMIAEDVGSVAEVIENGKNGFLVNGLEERILAISTLLNNKSLRKSMSVSAQKTAKNRFSVSQFVNNHEIAYKLALDRLRVNL